MFKFEITYAKAKELGFNLAPGPIIESGQKCSDSEDRWFIFVAYDEQHGIVWRAYNGEAEAEAMRKRCEQLNESAKRA